MDGIDPCSLLTDAQLAALGPQMRKVPAAEPGGPGRVCQLPSRVVSPFYEVLTTPGQGVARYTGSTPTRTSTPVAVAGFPALVVSRPVERANCFVVVDVADGQSLQVQRDDGTGPTPDQICSAAQSLAETVMTSLLATR